MTPARVFSLGVLGVLASARLAAAQCPDGTPPPCVGQVPRVPAPSPNSVAVLYFDNLSRDTGDAYLADGVTEDLIARLGQVRRLTVKSRYVSRYLRTQSSASPATLARMAGAAYLVNGSLRHSGNRLLIVAELMRAATGDRVWDTTLDRAASDILTVEGEIAHAVATGIAGRLLPVERARLARQPTRDPAAYDLYLRARFLADQGTEPGLRRAIELYHQATDRDSTYAVAWAGAALAWQWLQDNWLPPAEALPMAREATARALALDSLLPEAHAAYAQVLGTDLDFRGAEREVRRAAQLGPDREDVGLIWVAEAIAIPGLRREALATCERVLAADPYSVMANFTREYWLYLLRRYDDAIAQHRRTAALDSTFFYLDSWDGASWREKGQLDSALAAYQRAQRLAGDRPLYGLGVTLARMGRAAEAREVLRALEAYALDHYVPPSFAAFLHLALGDADSAYADFERAYRARDTLLWSLDLQPFLDPVRDDPRFIALRRRVFGR